MPKQFEYQQSEFKERVIVNKHNIKTLNEEEFQHLVGTDTVTAEMKEETEASAADILTYHYGTPVTVVKKRGSSIARVHVFSEEEMEEEIDENHRKLFRGKSIGSLTRGKRGKSAMDKAEIQKHLLEERRSLIQNREREWKLAEGGIKEYTVEASGKDRYTGEELKSIREFLVITDKYGKDQIDNSLFASPANAVNRYMYHLNQMNQMDLGQFSYQSDAEFVSQFAEKYDKLCKAAACEVLLRKYLELNVTDINRLPLSEIRAKIAVFRELKEDYEDRMRLLSSPYYVLLSRGDLSGLKAETGNAKLDEFKALVEKLSKSRTGKNANLEKLYAKMLEQSRTEQAEHDKTAVKELMGEIRIAEKRTTNDAAIAFYEEKKQKEQAGYPEEDGDFLRNCQTDFRGTLIYGMSREDLIMADEMVAMVLTENKLGKQQIRPEDRETVHKVITEYTKIRRKYMAACVAGRAVTGVVLGCGLDMKNPAFVKSPEYQQIMAVYGGEMGFYACQEDADRLKADYFRTLIDVFKTLSVLNYTLSEKYEPRIQTQATEAIEEARRRYQNSYYFAHAEEEKRYLDRGEALPKINFPAFRLNGVEYSNLMPGGLLDFLNGKEITVKDEQREEADRLMKAYMEDQKQICIVASLFNGEGGEKAIVNMAYTEKLIDRQQACTDRLVEILSDNVEGFQAYYDAYCLDLKQKAKKFGMAV